MRKPTYILFAIWAGLIFYSVFAASRVAGPRNLDTAFRAADVLFLWQVTAFAVAIAALLVAVFSRKLGRLEKIFGFAPVGLTVIAVSAIVLYTKFAQQIEIPDENRPVAPTTDAVTPVKPAPAPDGQ